MYKLISRYEDSIQKISLSFEEAWIKLKAVDARGGFEADDEVGFIFKFIKKTIKELSQNFEGYEERPMD